MSGIGTAADNGPASAGTRPGDSPSPAAQPRWRSFAGDAAVLLAPFAIVAVVLLLLGLDALAGR